MADLPRGFLLTGRENQWLRTTTWASSRNCGEGLFLRLHTSAHSLITWALARSIRPASILISSIQSTWHWVPCYRATSDRPKRLRQESPLRTLVLWGRL